MTSSYNISDSKVGDTSYYVSRFSESYPDVIEITPGHKFHFIMEELKKYGG